MTNKERITEILKAYTKKHNISASSVILEEYAEELLANGVIVPPCKVGDKLYEITSRKTISEYQVTAIHIELFGIFVDWKITQGFVDRYISDMPAGEIGKTVFLTREEAEKALERSKT